MLKDQLKANLIIATNHCYDYLQSKGEIIDEAISEYFNDVDIDELSEDELRRAALFFAGFISALSPSQDEVINELLELSLKKE